MSASVSIPGLMISSRHEDSWEWRAELQEGAGGVVHGSRAKCGSMRWVKGLLLRGWRRPMRDVCAGGLDGVA